jgi:GrpB-like predicted nucleotidyltransferase (UPF0157 family)
MLTHFDDCLRLMAAPRDELIATLTSNRRGTPLWHPLGFVSCTICAGLGWALKVHVWPKGSRRAKQPNWPIHDHLFRIDSRLLQGSIRNRVYEVRAGESLEMYSVDYESKASTLVPTGRFVDVTLARSAIQATDSRYVVELGEFHHSYVPTNALAASVVLKTARIEAHPFVIGRRQTTAAQLPLYERATYPPDVFWRLALADNKGPDPQVGLEAGIVRLVAFDRSWAEAYEAEVAVLRKLLGPEFLYSEHIGSTALPGVAEAKPIIDLMVAVPSMRAAVNLIDVLRTAGYVYRPDGSLPDRIYFNKRMGHHDTHHISLTTLNSMFWDEKIVFRDYLRAHPRRAEQYRRLKNRLAAAFPSDRPSYTKGKEDFVYSTLRKAVAERFDMANALGSAPWLHG